MRSFQDWLIMFAVAMGFAQQALGGHRASCPVTRPPDPPFTPPAPCSSSVGTVCGHKPAKVKSDVRLLQSL